MCVVMNRRDLLRIGVSSAALPAAGLAQQPQHQHVADLPASAAVNGAGWKPRVFDAHQHATVDAMADLVIPATDTPGAKAALVSRYLDLILAGSTNETRASFLEGLGWLDGYTIRLHRAPFVSLPPERQVEVLTALDLNSGGGVETGHTFFRSAKSWIAQIYYRTEIGVKELNKEGRVPSTILACDHPTHP